VMRAKRSDPLSTIFLLLDSLVVDAIIRRPVLLDGFALIYIYIFFSLHVLVAWWDCLG